MPDEALISEIENLLTEIIDLGGANELTSIVPNLTVQDANPTGLDGYIIVSDDRDGDNITAKKVGSVIYTNGDLVNVMFLKGAEAIAFQQGSQSSNSGMWEIVPSTSTDIYYNKGDVGIGTATIPHGGVGIAKFAINGPNASSAGPHIQITTDADDHPLLQVFPFLHDNIALCFDSYYDGSVWKSADAGSNYQIYKVSDELKIRYDSTIAQGANITWNEGVSLNASGQFGVNQDIIHIGDPDTKMSFADDDVEFTVGNLSMLKLTEAGQDVIRLGPGSGDVDINFNGDMFLQGSSGRLGIATITPGAPLDINAVGTVAIFGSGGSSVGINFDGAPSSVRDMVFLSDGFARWIFRVNATAESGGDAGSDFVIQSRTDAGGLKADVFLLKRSSGFAGFGVATPLAKVHIDQASTVAAVPVLYLDQADISEEMIEFNTTIGVGNPIEAVGAKTLTTTHFIKVTLPGSLTRYIPCGTIA